MPGLPGYRLGTLSPSERPSRPTTHPTPPPVRLDTLSLRLPARHAPPRHRLTKETRKDRWPVGHTPGYSALCAFGSDQDAGRAYSVLCTPREYENLPPGAHEPVLMDSPALEPDGWFGGTPRLGPTGRIGLDAASPRPATARSAASQRNRPLKNSRRGVPTSNWIDMTVQHARLLG